MTHIIWVSFIGCKLFSRVSIKIATTQILAPTAACNWNSCLCKRFLLITKFVLIEHASLFHKQLIRARVWLFCICQFGSVWTLNVEGCFFKIVSILVVLTVAFKSSSRLEKISISTKLPQKIFENNINVRFDQISKHSKKI